MASNDETVSAGDPDFGAPGQIVREYRIVRELGRGGMGIVFEAEHIDLPLRYALKMLHPRISDKDEFVRRFRQEGNLQARLKHPNIVAIRNLILHEGKYFLVMDFVQGDPLATYLKNRNGTPVPVNLMARWMREFLLGLAHAHAAGIIHRDLKPSNLLIGDSDVLQIADFGLAQAAGPEFERSIIARPEGTPDFMAPEVMAGTTPDARSDIYALGVIAYEISTGERPKGAYKPPSKFVPQLNASWDQFVRRCLEPQPEHRFQSVNEALTAFDKINLSDIPRRKKVGFAAIMIVPLIALFFLIRNNKPIVPPSPVQSPLQETNVENPEMPVEIVKPTERIVRLVGLVRGAEALVGGIKQIASAGGEIAFSLTPGTHHFEIRAEGYEPWSSSVTVDAEDIELRPILDRSPPFPLVITGPPLNAHVAIDDGSNVVEGHIRADGKCVLEIRPGSSSIRVHAFRYHDLNRLIKFSPDSRILSLMLEPKDHLDIPMPDGVTPISIRRVVPGEFLFGPTIKGPKIKNARERTRTIQKEFYLGAYEVFLDQWVAIYGKDVTNRFQHNNPPAGNISWRMLIDERDGFIAKLNLHLIKEGLPFIASIPTEVEWEYACRAGDSDNGGKQTVIIHNVAAGRSDTDYPLPRGSDALRSNAWHFFDMLGNLAEWTLDEETGGPVLRGGHYLSTSDGVTITAREPWRGSTQAEKTIGFRVLLRPTD